MIRAILWKEMREQGLIVLMLALLGTALLIGAVSIFEPPKSPAPAGDLLASLGAARMLALMLVLTAGLVSGGALFASEKESGTISFLAALPANQWSIWRAKVIAGLVLAIIQVALLLCVTVLLEVGDGQFVSRLAIYALLAFSWGTLGSTLARTTLGSVGIAIPAATLAMILFLVPITILMPMPSQGGPQPTGWLLFALLMLGTPLAVSAWRFTALDRLRAAHAYENQIPVAGEPSGARGRPAGWGIRALFWLSFRQIKYPGLIFSTFAIVFGLALLLPEMRPVFIWPSLALAAGVLAGVTAFGSEQTHGTSLFWSEHRLPIHRAWCVKIISHLLLLGWLLVLIALPSYLRVQFQSSSRLQFGQTSLAAVMQSRLFDELGPQGWKYLLAPAIYGFVFGHVSGLLVRKLVVACGVAIMLGGVLTAAWAPSLLSGGVRHWQLWSPALAVLLTGLFLMRPWSSDRISDRGSLSRIAVGVAATILVFTGSITFRVLQISEAENSTEDIAFVASLPPYEENIGGREFRIATDRFSRLAGHINDSAQAAEARLRMRLGDRLETAVRIGWPSRFNDAELNIWLDWLFTAPAAANDDKTWDEMAAAAANRPIGVFELPQMAGPPAATTTALENARRMTFALAARGLQLQTDGDVHSFFKYLRICIAYARTIRNGGGLQALETAIELERIVLTAADQWLERLPPREIGLVLKLAAVLGESDDNSEFSLRPYLLADRYIVREMMQAPVPWLQTMLAPPNWPPEETLPEADLIAMAWTVPWERERTRRLISKSPEGFRPDASGHLTGRPGSILFQGRNRSMLEMVEREMFLRVWRRALILKSALRAYRYKYGQPPETLTMLVEKECLAALPEDPFGNGNTFGYRISAGEELRGPPRPGIPGRFKEDAYILPVSAGEIILWSIGLDRVDQGGRVPPTGPRAADIVFLVPQPRLLPWEEHR